MKKQQKTKQKTLVSVILDESGSMEVVRKATIDGFNNYVHGLKGDVSLTLTKFNSDNIVIPFSDTSLKRVPLLSSLTYNPAGWTPLYDAVGQTIKNLEKEAKGKEVMVVIMTDGLENASKEFTQQSIAELIAEKKRKGWLFTFLGANQDAWVTSKGLGIDMANAVNYQATGASVQAAFRVMTVATNNFSANASSVRGTGALNMRNVEDYQE